MSVFNEHELKSALWMRLKGHLEARVAVLQRELEGDLGPEKTSKVRGRIAEVRKLLAHGEVREGLRPPIVRHPNVDYS